MSETAAVAAAPSAPATEAGASPVIDQTQDAGDQQAQASEKAQAQPKAKPAPKAAAELFELKVNGKTVKMTKEELIQHASMGHAADQRFKEAAQMRKQAEAVIGKLRDPKSVISALQDPALGLSKDQIREQFEEWYAREFIEPESLTPEQKKLREAEAKLKKYEEDEKARAEEKLKNEQEAMTTQAREQLQGQIIEALETSGLPKTNFTIRRLAYWMQRNQANGFDAPIDVVVGQVRNEINSSLRDLVEASDGEVLIKILGDGVIQKLRKYDLEQLRKMRGQGGAQVQSVQEGPEPTPRSERPTSSDVNQRIRELQRTGRY